MEHVGEGGARQPQRRRQQAEAVAGQGRAEDEQDARRPRASPGRRRRGRRSRRPGRRTSQTATTAATMKPVRGSTRAMAVPKSCQRRRQVVGHRVPRGPRRQAEGARVAVEGEAGEQGQADRPTRATTAPGPSPRRRQKMASEVRRHGGEGERWGTSDQPSNSRQKPNAVASDSATSGDLGAPVCGVAGAVAHADDRLPATSGPPCGAGMRTAVRAASTRTIVPHDRPKAPSPGGVDAGEASLQRRRAPAAAARTRRDHRAERAAQAGQRVQLARGGPAQHGDERRRPGRPAVEGVEHLAEASRARRRRGGRGTR